MVVALRAERFSSVRRFCWRRFIRGVLIAVRDAAISDVKLLVG